MSKIVYDNVCLEAARKLYRATDDVALANAGVDLTAGTKDTGHTRKVLSAFGIAHLTAALAFLELANTRTAIATLLYSLADEKAAPSEEAAGK